MQDDMTPGQSLKLIEEMIAQAKRSFHRQSYYFMLWGILLIAAMLFNYVMVLRGSDIGGYAWSVMGVVGGVLSFIHGAREGRSKPVTSPIDRIIVWLWMAFVATLLITMFAGAGSEHTMPIGSIIVLTGMPTFVTGQLIRFRPLVFGGLLFWVLGAVSYFVPMSAVVWIFIAAIFFGYLVPGYLLKRQEDGVRPA